MKLRILGILVSISVFFGSFALACDCKVPRKREKLEVRHDKNMVQEPTYTYRVKRKLKQAEEPPPPEKLQYEPITSEMPLLMEKKLDREQGLGAEYDEGNETVVAPRSSEVVKDEPIVDASPEPTPASSSAQSASNEKK